jgi:hexosaminidase
VQSIVSYAKERGIAVLPELDMPGHSTSWQRGYPEIASKCSNTITTAGESSDESGSPVGSGSGFTTPMDPTANATYGLLKTLLEELDPLFPKTFGTYVVPTATTSRTMPSALNYFNGPR